jgi:alkylhydroperoxidase family enzyme
MTTATAPPPRAASRETPFHVPADGKVWGEIVAWSPGGVRVPHADVVAALKASGLDPAEAREFSPRNAWLRAKNQLKESRVICELPDDPEAPGKLRFQFNTEKPSAGGALVEYPFETVVSVDRETGDLACDDGAVLALARAKFEECRTTRTGADLSQIVQRVLSKHGELFPVRDQGGCYFVPAAHLGFVEKVERFVTLTQGRMSRFPVAKGTETGDASVRDAVVDGLAAVITDHEKAVEAWDVETRQGTIDRAVGRVRVTREKLAAYAEYLGDQRAALEAALADADGKLRAKVAELARTKAAAEAVAGVPAA